MNKINFPLTQGTKRSQANLDLQDGLVFLLGKQFFDMDDDVAQKHKLRLGTERGRYGEQTRELVELFQTKQGIEPSGVAKGEVDQTTAEALNTVLTELGALTEPATGEHLVEGRIFMDDGRPADDVSLILYRRAFGEVIEESDKTDEQGFYEFSYDPGGEAANFEIWAVDTEGEKIQLSAAKFNASKHEVLNLVAPATVKAPDQEYNKLTEDLEKQLGGDLKKLADAKEGVADDGTAEHRDLTLLHQATGWDARLIAVAATAVKQSAETGIPQDALYAMYRAGLPTDKELLSNVSVDTVSRALEKATEAGIVQLKASQFKTAKESFAQFARTARLTATPAGALSSVQDLLEQSSLEGHVSDPDSERAKFADILLTHQGRGAELWKAAREKGISDTKINALQLQGKLAYLTVNNARLTAALQNTIDSPDNLAQLIDQDFDRAKKWEAELMQVAEVTADSVEELSDDDKEKLQALIPPAYISDKADKGENLKESLTAYAGDMARKVRLSYPTQVVRRNIEQGQLRLGDDHDDIKAPVAAFLKNADKLGFELGGTPVESFLQQHKERVFEGIDANIEATTESVKTLNRLYQTTPGDASLKVLFDHGFKSANDVVAYPYEDFIDRYGDLFPSREEARLVYRKARQISAVTVNMWTGIKNLDTAPFLYAVSGTAERREEDKESLKKTLKQLPTMESLFGSLDFCECEHCRSVLSPAAYLVDLLQFLEPEDLVWKKTLELWKETHNQEPYQKDWEYDRTGEAYKDERKKPFYALIERRPDLPHLPLTCENTNTALPYIDLVNEILEFYVANTAANKEGLEGFEGYDTGAATTLELLAEPQNITSKAYEEVAKARYPLTLPFDLSLETVRRFLDHFETPLWRVLETFRPTDALFPAATDPKPYYRASVFAESLGISLADYAVFTNDSPLDKWFELYGFKTRKEATDEAVDEHDQRIDLNSAKALSRRLGVSYKEVAELARTGFINPDLDALAILRKLGIDTRDVFRYKEDAAFLSQSERNALADGRTEPAFEEEQKAFEQRLVDLTETFEGSGFDAKAWIDKAWSDGEFKEILVLADPDTGCNFDLTTLRYADGKEATALDFLKINLFVRLWRKLGWTIRETDRALQVLLPSDSLRLINDSSKTEAERAVALSSALKTALLYLAHFKALDDKVSTGKDNRLRLLTLWSDLSTRGNNSLYGQFFLTHSALKNDPIFDHPLGEYLSSFDATTKQYKPFEWNADKPEDAKKGNVSMKNHLLAMQGAINLTADEIGDILADAQNLPNAETALDAFALTLANVSLLYRYAALAKVLKLDTHELLSLKALSGLDPFKPLEPNPLNDEPDPEKVLGQDYPLQQTLAFVEIAEKVKESGFSIEDLDYLLRHRFDPVGKYRPNDDAVLAFVRSLATEIHRIQAEHAIPDDPVTFTDDMLRQKLALALPPDVAEAFFAMWTGDVTYEEKQENIAPDNRLDPGVFKDAPAIRVSYDTVRETQRFVYRGVLLEEQKEQLATAFPAVKTLLDGVQKQAKDFFDKHLRKHKIDEVHDVGFLDDSDFDLLFEPSQEEGSKAEKQELNKRKRLTEAFLPFLQQRLIRQAVVQMLASTLSADPILIEALLTDTELLAEPEESGKALLNAFGAVDESGVSVEYFKEGGKLLQQEVVKSIDAKAQNNRASADGYFQLPSDAKSACFSGYLEVPATGAYRFYVTLDKKHAEADLSFAHLPDPVIRFKSAKKDDGTDEYVDLKQGVPHKLTLELRNLGGGAKLLVQGENLPKGSLARLTLYPQAAVERVQRAQFLLAKVVQIIQVWGMSEREVRHILTHKDDFGIDLSKLPTAQTDDSTPEARTAANEKAALLFAQFLRLAGYTRLKREIAEGTDDLISIFENARRTYSAPTGSASEKKAATDRLTSAVFEDLCKRIADLTRRSPAVVRAVARHLGFVAQSSAGNDGDLLVEAPHFAQGQGFQRLWETLQVVEKLGVPVDAIARWATPSPDFAIARDLKNTVKARYEPESWHRVAQPIFDKLRQRQRDALVAYVMHRHPEGFKSANQLFEYFLVDPGMEPVVQTSRLRLAISSVQVFIQRCLLNLERHAHPHPSIINSKQWQWMKRYRVWEASRKIFLFPENWLEPEFRDDKTHLFQELESSLLQGDVSNELAENAFFQYLKKLEELARLDIVTMYLDEKAEAASNVLHVIGRTFSLPHKYFYRRYTSDQMWTPWEPVTAEIEGDHVVAVVWQERLHLFWVTFLEKAQNTGAPGGISDDAKIGQIAKSVFQITPLKQIEIQLSWSEYFQGQWTTRESGGFGNPVRMNVGNNYNTHSIFIYVSKEGPEDRTIRVNLIFGPALVSAFRVVSKNSQPEPYNYSYEEAPSLPQPPYQLDPQARATKFRGSNALQVNFVERIKTEEGNKPEGIRTPHEILSKGGGYSLLSSAKPPTPPAAEFESWINPFFYQDNRHTFFVEPALIEAIDQWEEYAPLPAPAPKPVDDEIWNVPVERYTPLELGLVDPIGPIARYKLREFQRNEDWMTNPATVVQFDNSLISQSGEVDLAALTSGVRISDLSTLVDGDVADDLIKGQAAVTLGEQAINLRDLRLDGDSLNVIGGAGLTSDSITSLRNANLGRRFTDGVFGGGFINR